MARLNQNNSKLLYGEALVTPFVLRPYKWTCTGMQGPRRRYWQPYTLVKGGWRRIWLAGSWFKYKPVYVGRAIKFRISLMQGHEDTTIGSKP